MHRAWPLACLLIGFGCAKPESPVVAEKAPTPKPASEAKKEPPPPPIKAVGFTQVAREAPSTPSTKGALELPTPKPGEKQGGWGGLTIRRRNPN